MITFLASILIWLMFFGLIVLWVVDGKLKRNSNTRSFSCFLAWIVTESIKAFFPTLRPFQVQDLAPLTLTIPSDGTFPSTHSAIAFALSITILNMTKSWPFYIL